ncbi:MAG TPA: LacI family DNA-binding transcriptional regulator [Pyrinomonadaceae bacterium]|nr:LacI family DNA-binding transcriptional regulator [Pyrinomonadaceae bacterium]
MSVTLADIARELGLSKMTVSRAINNDPLVNEKTRERVLEVSRRLNYQPNHFARALVTNRSFLIGVIVPDLMHSYFAEIMHGISGYARGSNYQIVIGNSEENISREIDEVEALRWRTDGLIIAPTVPASKADVYRKILERGTKIVLIDRTLEGVDCPMVTTDNVEVGVIATEHLIKLGHSKIGHLRGTMTSTSRERFEGYKQALSKNDLQFDKKLVRDCGLMESEGYRAMRSWIEEGDLPTAIFAVNDPAAIGAMQAMSEAGLKIGKDIAIVGGGNIHYGDMLSVPLTTVSWSRSEMGQAAARLLIQSIEANNGDAANQKVILSPTLIVRESCGAHFVNP